MDSNASKIKGGFSNSNLLNLEDVKNFIKNLNYIYPSKILNLYKNKYPIEFNNLNNNIMEGFLSISWGLSNIENNNRVNIDNNKAFQQKNIEMKEIKS